MVPTPGLSTVSDRATSLTLNITIWGGFPKLDAGIGPLCPANLN